MISHGAKQEDRLALSRLRHRLGTLPARDQSVPCRVRLDGWNHDDMAAELEIAAGTVKSRLFRVRERLMIQLDKVGQFRDRTQQEAR